MGSRHDYLEFLAEAERTLRHRRKLFTKHGKTARSLQAELICVKDKAEQGHLFRLSPDAFRHVISRLSIFQTRLTLLISAVQVANRLFNHGVRQAKEQGKTQLIEFVMLGTVQDPGTRPD